MKVCGVELKGSEAILCFLGYNQGAFEVPDCRQRQFVVAPSEDTDVIRKFQFAFKKLMDDYKIEEIVILTRDQKGKFAGSATSFKLESAIQLIDMPVSLIATTEVKEQLKKARPMAEITALGLKKFQQQAFNAAYAYLNQKL